MAAHIRINEVSREPAQTITYPDGTQSVVRLFYIDVDFWATRAGFLAGNPPLVSNDFRMQLSRTARVVATDVNGNWIKADGSAVDPATLTGFEGFEWQYQTIQINPIDQIKANIAKFIQSEIAGKGRRGDLRDRRIVRQQTDSTGILALISSLTGTDSEV